MNKLVIVLALISCVSCSIQETQPVTYQLRQPELFTSSNISREANLRQLHEQVESNPDNPEYLYKLAIAYLDDAEETSSQASRDKALEYFQQVLTLAPDNPSTLQAIYNVQYKNTLHQGQEKLALAKASYNQLSPEIRSQLNPPSLALFIHHYIRQTKAKQKDYLQLQQLLLDALAEQPSNANTYIHLSSLYQHQGYYPMAIANLKFASEHIQDSAELYTALAKAYEEYAEYQGCTYENLALINAAIDNYKRAIPLDSENPELHFRLAQLYLDNNQYQLALNETAIILDIDPTPENLAFMAQQYSMHNNQAKAKALLDKAQRQGLDGDDPSFHEIYMNSGDWLAAAQAFIKYANTRKQFNAYDAIKADIISEQSKQNLTPLIHKKEIHFRSDWEAAVFAFWTNKITEQQLAKQASNRCERTELFFYSGYRNLIAGNSHKARREFAAALQQNTYRFIERPLARHFLEKD